MNNNRVEELVAGMNSFCKEEYHKSEVLEELLALQSEIVNLAFNGEHASLADLKIYDVERHLDRLNEDRGHIADVEMQDFHERSKEFSNMIRAEISGNIGENKAVRSLDYLKKPHHIIRNVELDDGDRKTELDAVVITSDGITIVEVKNTRRNIFIDEKGDYYRTGEYLSFDKNIAERMLTKELLLRNALKTAGIENVEIHKIIVFTDNRIEVQNKCEMLHTCFLSQMSSIIDGFKGDTEMPGDYMNRIKDAIEKSSCRECYPIEFDVAGYKRSFAETMARLEAVVEEQENETCDIEDIVTGSDKDGFAEKISRIFSSKYIGYVGKVAAMAVISVATGMVAASVISK